MFKKIAAMIAAVVILLCVTGCNSEPVQEETNGSDILTYEELLGMIGMEEANQAPKNDLSFEMVYKLGNNDELNAFVEGVGAQQPASYTRTISQEGYEASLTVHYNVTSVSMELLETYNGQTNVQTFENVALSMPYMYELFMTEDGQVDGNSFVMSLYQSGLYGWYSINPSIFTQCVHYLVATLPTGEQLLVDYYYDEALSEQLEQLYAAQG